MRGASTAELPSMSHKEWKNKMNIVSLGERRQEGVGRGGWKLV